MRYGQCRGEWRRYVGVFDLICRMCVTVLLLKLFFGVSSGAFWAATRCFWSGGSMVMMACFALLSFVRLGGVYFLFVCVP